MSQANNVSATDTPPKEVDHSKNELARVYEKVFTRTKNPLIALVAAAWWSKICTST